MADDSAKKMSEQSDLERIAAILLRHKVEFLVIGGQAEVLMRKQVTDSIAICPPHLKNYDRANFAHHFKQDGQRLGKSNPHGVKPRLAELDWII
jgi:hypothetical protein